MSSPKDLTLNLIHAPIRPIQDGLGALPPARHDADRNNRWRRDRLAIPVDERGREGGSGVAAPPTAATAHRVTASQAPTR